MAGQTTDEEDTDTKIAILASLFPGVDPSTILEALVEANGSVAIATQHLQPFSYEPAWDSTVRPATSPPPAKRVKVAGLGSQHDHGRDVPTPVPSQQLSIRKYHAGPKPLSGRIRPARKGQTLHLYDPDDIAAHTPCSVIHNFLPTEDANSLLRELLEESKTFGKATFQLFERTVSSPHTSSFYVDSAHEQRSQQHEFVYNGSHLTDVRRITPGLGHVAGPIERAVNSEIKKRIVDWYPGGQKLKYQSPERWKPNCAFVNCYDGGKESVGAHADQLTYLGPRAVIGSLSLGVAREFRVRRIIPKDEPPLPEGADEEGVAESGFEGSDARDDLGFANGLSSDRSSSDFLPHHAATTCGPQPAVRKRKASSPGLDLGTVPVPPGSEKAQNVHGGPETMVLPPSPSRPVRTGTAHSPLPSPSDEGGQIAIHLPHNSLLVMHAEMQEEWKHAIAPAQTLVPHPIAGLKRINVTYRWYRPEFHPRFTPRCHCDMPVVLRCVQRRAANHGRYMWMCHVNYAPGKEGCGYFKWADFDDDGKPEWARDRTSAHGGKIVQARSDNWKSNDVGSPSHGQQQEQDDSGRASI